MPRNVMQDSIVLYPQLKPRGGFQQNFGRIIGGTPVGDIAEFPFIAHLAVKRGDKLFGCAGVIVSATQLITAGHCLDGDDVEKVTATAGTVTWAQLGENGQKRVSSGDNFEAHEFFVFDSTHIDSDIGFITIDDDQDPFDLSGDFVQAIDFANADPIEGAQVTVVGWGLIETGGDESPQLNVAEDLPVVSFEDANIFSTTFPKEQFFCTSNREGGLEGSSLFSRQNQTILVAFYLQPATCPNL